MNGQKKDQIIFLLGEIKERFEAIKDPKADCIHIDLILEEIRMVYRELELLKLKSLNFDQSVGQNEEESVQKDENEETPEPMVETFEVLTSEPSPEPEPEPAEDTNIDEERQPDFEAPKPDDRPKSEANLVIDVNGKAEKSAVFVADKLRVEDNSIYKRFLAETQDKSIGSRLQATPIKTIKDAIGLNEKFLFINELFSGNIQDYNTAVEKLDGFEDAQDAFGYLNELGKTCNWDFDRSEDTIRTFVNLVQRRYMKG